MKLPRLPKMPKFRMPRPRKKLEARTRSADQPMLEDYDADEPQTKLSSAFIVVLLLHVVAVGGIYSFNSIKATRRAQESASGLAAPVTAKPAAVAPVAAAAERPAPAQQLPPAPVPVSASVPKHYAVKPGETLTSISKQFGVTVPEIEAANGLKPAATLRIGQPLIIPGKGAAKPVMETAKLETAPKKQIEAAARSAAPRIYTVKEGDRLLFIARRFSVSQDELMAVNKITDASKLRAGTTLKIPVKKN